MTQPFWIGYYAFVDALRNRLVLGLLVLALPLLGVGWMLRANQIDLQVQIIKDLGLNLQAGFGLLVLFVLVLDQIFPDLERKSVYFVLTRMPSRQGYLAGRFLGIAATLVFCHVVLGGFLLAYLRVGFGRWFPEVLLGALVIWMKQCVLAALVILLAAAASKIVVLSLGTLLYVVGHLFDVMRLWTERQGGGLAAIGLELVAFVLPDFSLFETRLLVVHELPVSITPLAMIAAYSFVLILVYIGLGGRLLARRDL